MQLATAYRLAQERLGLLIAVAALQAWRLFNPSASSPDRSFLRRLIAKATSFRSLHRLLAMRYLNASRALVGTAGPNPQGEPYGASVTLARLFQDFVDSVDEVRKQSTPATSQDVPEGADGGATTEQGDALVERVGRNESRAEATVDGLEAALEELRKLFPPDPVDVDEDIEWPEPDDGGDDFSDVMQRDLDRSLDDLDKFIDNVDTLLTTPPSDVEDEPQPPTAREIRDAIEKQTRNTGFDLAAYLEKIVSSYGRNLVDEFGSDDPAVVGWIRVTSAGPCSFCAKLASQGIVYKSRSTASETAGGSDGNGNRGRNSTSGFTRREVARSARARSDVNDVGGTGLNQYHDNCRCITVPVYLPGQKRQERDRFFEALYAESTKNTKKQPNAKLNAFRRALAKAYREGKVPGGSPLGAPAPMSQN